MIVRFLNSNEQEDDGTDMGKCRGEFDFGQWQRHWLWFLEIPNHNVVFKRQFSWLINGAGPKLRKRATQKSKFESFPVLVVADAQSCFVLIWKFLSHCLNAKEEKTIAIFESQKVWTSTNYIANEFHKKFIPLAQLSFYSLLFL